MGSFLPVGAFLERLSLLEQGLLLTEVLVEVLADLLEELVAALEELVAGGVETVVNLLVLLPGGKADSAPFLLQLDDFCGLLLPVAVGLQVVIYDAFDGLTEGGFGLKILFLTGADDLEVLLVASVDLRHEFLEVVPNLVTLFAGHGTDFAPLLEDLLHVAIGRHNVWLLDQFFSSLGELQLTFEVLLEVVIAQLMVDLNDVVETFGLDLVVVPKFLDVLLRYGVILFPFLLDFAELVVSPVEVVRAFDEGFHTVDEVQLLEIVFLTHTRPLFLQFGTALLVSV